MKKIKYYYNTHTLRYEKLETPLRVNLLRLFGFIAGVIVAGFLFLLVAYKYFPSTNEKMLQQQNADMRNDYKVLQQQLQQLQQQMAELENRDNNVYRTIFESSPVPDSIRLQQMAKSKEVKMVQSMSSEGLVKNMTKQLNMLAMRVAYQERSVQ